jgi:hypothetical protein
MENIKEDKSQQNTNNENEEIVAVISAAISKYMMEREKMPIQIQKQPSLQPEPWKMAGLIRQLYLRK